MAKKFKQIREDKISRKRELYIIAIPLLVLLIKFIIMANIKAGAWLGADGENYLKGVEGLQADGFFSGEPKLSFWPAGYPLLMWPVAEITTHYFFYIISSIQSLFFAYSTYFFFKHFLKSNVKEFALLGALFISFNPTLSLGTLSIGYESPVASCFLMILGLSFKLLQKKDCNTRYKFSIVAQVAGWFALIIFMQPRFIIVSFIFLMIFSFAVTNKEHKLKLISLSLIIILLSPGIMIFRNYKVIGEATISTNLGVTMAIGAGPETTGSYVHKGPEVPCSTGNANDVVSDNEKVKCILAWYAKNPIQTLRLSFNKSQFFWSPWSGPLADGTMARNPWLNIAPAYTVMKNEEGSKLVLGPFGRLISYFWILGQLVALFFGFWTLAKRGRTEKIYAALLLSPVIISWIVAMGTIGDHRFRIPTMSLSLMLQSVAFKALVEKISKAT